MDFFKFWFLRMALSVISVNLSELGDEDRWLEVLQRLSHLSISVICLQGIRAVSSTDLQLWLSRFVFLCAGSFGSAHSCRTVVLYRPVFECRSVVCEFDRRFVLVELAFHGAVFRVACICAPNRNPDRDDLFVRCVSAIGLGGFSAVDFQCKVSALHVQWVCHFVSSVRCPGFP